MECLQVPILSVKALTALLGQLSLKRKEEKTNKQNSVDPDETTHEPSHLDLHCLHRYMHQSIGLEGFCWYLEHM